MSGAARAAGLLLAAAVLRPASLLATGGLDEYLDARLSRPVSLRQGLDLLAAVDRYAPDDEDVLQAGTVPALLERCAGLRSEPSGKLGRELARRGVFRRSALLPGVFWGNYYLANGRFGEASREFRALLRAKGGAPMAYDGLIRVELARGRPLEALDEFIRSESSVEIRFQAATHRDLQPLFVLLQASSDVELDAAERRLDSALPRYHAMTRGARALILLDRGALAEAETSAREAMERPSEYHPDWPALVLGGILARRGRLAAAAEALSEARALNAQSRIAGVGLDAALELGWVYDRLGQPERARALYRAFADDVADRGAGEPRLGVDDWRGFVRRYESSSEPGPAEALLAAMSERLPGCSSVWLERAALASRAGRADEASAFLARAQGLRPRPSSAAEPVERAVRDAKDGLRGRALAELSTAEGLAPTDEERRLMAQAYFELDRPERALRQWRLLTRAAPDDARRWIGLAEAARRAGDRVSALDALERARTLRPGDGGRRRIVTLYLALGATDRALSVWETVADRRPADAGEWIEQAVLAANAGERSLAGRLLEAVERAGPGPDERRVMAELFERAGDADRALEQWRRLTAAAAAEPSAWLGQAGAAQRAGRRELALESLRQAGRAILDPDQRRAAAKLFAALGEPESALACWRAPGAPGREDAADLLDLAAAAAKAGRPRSALEALGLASAAGLDAAGALRAVELFGELGRPEEAAALLRKVAGSRATGLRVEKLDDPGLLLDLAGAALAAGDRALASRCVARARGLPLGAEQLGWAAMLHQELKEYPRALDALDRLVGEQPSRARWRSDRGVLRMLMRRPREAAADFEAAIGLDRGFLPAYVGLGSLYASAGRRRDALALYAGALEQPAAEPEARRRIESEYRRLRAEEARAAR